MNQKSVIALAVLAVLMTGMLLLSESGTDRSGFDERFLPGLAEALPSATRVILRKGESTVSLVRDGQAWGVAERAGYSADQQKLSALTRSLASAGILERKTARPENHERLELDPASATHVGIELPERTLSVLLGKAPGLGEGIFARRDGEDQAWLIDQSPEVSIEPAAWLEPVIVNVEPETILRVELLDAEGESVLAVARETGSENLVLENLPEGRELRYGTITNPFRRALTNLTLEDVAPHDAGRFTGARTATFETEAGVITVSALQSDAGRWIHIQGAGDEVAAWDYAVAEYVFDDFVKSLEDLLKPLPEDEA